MGKKSVLVVEDHELWQSLLRDYFNEIGVTVTLATTYDEGVRALEEGGYDLLIFDNTLHEISNASADLIQDARRLKLPAPILVYSAQLPEDMQETVKALGATYVDKASGQVAFRTAVRELLGM